MVTKYNSNDFVVNSVAPPTVVASSQYSNPIFQTSSPHVLSGARLTGVHARQRAGQDTNHGTPYFADFLTHFILF
jgi:hypothetical protein